MSTVNPPYFDQFMEHAFEYFDPFVLQCALSPRVYTSHRPPGEFGLWTHGSLEFEYAHTTHLFLGTRIYGYDIEEIFLLLLEERVGEIVEVFFKCKVVEASRYPLEQGRDGVNVSVYALIGESLL